MDKKTLRKVVLEKRDSMSGDEIKQKSRAVFENLSETDCYKDAENILIFASFGSEVSTEDIILDALSLGKRVFCPKVTDKKAGIMDFIRIYDPEELKEGYFHIREPEIREDSEIFGRMDIMEQENREDIEIFGGNDTEEPSRPDKSDICSTLMIMPLVAFDENRNRIGYGGGFYDRFLTRFKDITTAAIAFDCQKSDDLIAAEEFDMSPGMIITESGIFM